MKCGSLFTGAGGLDMAVERAFGSDTVWHSEIDAAAAKVLAHRYPRTPNHGDITRIDWSAVEPVDILCGGFPCQDVSSAGLRAGLKHGTRSGLWAVYAEAVDALRPTYVVIENVRGLLNAEAHRHLEPVAAAVGNASGGPVLRAAGAVLGDLADLGYDAKWATVSASSVGAPHRRGRVFIIANPPGAERRQPDMRHRHTVQPLERRLQLLPTPEAKNAHAGQDFARAGREGSGGDDLVTAVIKAHKDGRWSQYEPAIRRWSETTRPAPAPVEANTKGSPQLNAAFAEWMLGWPARWATGVDGVGRNDQLRIIGNGVCPQQAFAALERLLGIEDS